MRPLSAPGPAWKLRAGPAGLHLFNRAAGSHILLDELTPPKQMWSRAPRSVSIALTNACDLECSYCYAPKVRAVLSLETLQEWLIELDRHGCLGVGFGGGEPTIYPSLVALCHFAVQKTRLAISITTHAHRLTSALIEKLAGAVHFVRISVDGVGKTYETLRGRAFAALVARLCDARRLAPTGLNVLVNRQTLPDLDAAVDLAVSSGASEVLLLPERPTASTPGIDEASRLALQAWVTNYRGPIPLSVSQLDADGFPVCDPFGAEGGLSSYAHIDASGSLKATSYDTVGEPIGRMGVLTALDRLRNAQGVTE
jgi:hypothetical protein